MDVLQYAITFKDRATLFAAVYEFLHMKSLNNPEITLFMPSKGSDTPEILTYSRNGDSGRGRIPGKKKWVSLIAEDPEAIMCVAGTDKEDQRRMTLAYMRMDEPKLMLSFPGATAKLNGKEEEILEAMKALAAV